MKKQVLVLIAALCVALVGWSVVEHGASRVRRVPTAQGDGTIIYGEVTHSNSMDVTSADGLAWGLYSFNASSPMTVSPISIHNSLCANGGGTYRKGKLYFTSYYEDMTGELGYLYFIEMDLSNYAIERHALVPSTYDAICADMTYDPVGDKIYGVGFNPDDTSGNSYQLVYFDLTTGYPTKVANIARMSAIACDNMGQMWGVRYSDGKFVKINKVNAEVTEVGNTGVNPKYNGSACFDFETGKLYWSTNERTTEESGLYMIDTATGAASLIAMYPDGESFSSLYIPRADDIATLSEVSDLKADFVGSNLDGTISFKAPATKADGSAVTGNVTVSCYMDEALSFQKEVAPGAEVSRDYSLSQGKHTFEVVATHPTAGKSNRSSISFFVGSDGPAAVPNLVAQKVADNKIKLTWDTPQTGANGGSINPNLLYYKIVRMPDGKILTDEATGNSYTDNLTPDLLRAYSYEVTGYYKNNEGAVAVSNTIELGTPAAMPYLQTFDTQADFNTFVVRDDNYDAIEPNRGRWSWESSRKCAAYGYHTLFPGDDWLITPGFELAAGQTYRLKFKNQGGRYYAETLEVRIGQGYSPAQMNQTIMGPTEILSPNGTMSEREFTFNVEQSGHYYIGFHCISPKGQYSLYVDDIALEEGASMSAPVAATELSLTPGATASEVNVSFKCPEKDINGQQLATLTSVKVYRGETLVKTLSAAEGVAPGATVTCTDANVPAGKHTYKLVANNGSDGESVEAEVYAGLDTPTPVTALSHTSADGVAATLSWTAPTAGVNGGSLAYEPLKYTIKDAKGNVVADNVETTTYTDNNIDTTDGQKCMIYTVYAKNGKGVSEGAESDFITYGAPYQDSFAESFAGGKKPTTSEWVSRVLVESPYDNGFYGRYFAFSHNPQEWDRGPMPTAHDNDGGMLVAYTDFLDVEARMISPKINVKGLKNPVLTFWFYHYFNSDTEKGYSTEKETMDVEVLVDGQYKSLLARPLYLINGNGWYRYDLPLAEAVGNKDFQIAFHTHNYISYDMHVDEISVHETPDYDLAVTGLTVDQKISVNDTRNAAVTVRNYGVKTASDYKVELYRDNELFDSVDAESELLFSKETQFLFPITPDVFDAGNTHTYYAKVVYNNDEDLSNNESRKVNVTTSEIGLPKVKNVKGKVNWTNGEVTLSWDKPRGEAGEPVNEGFEGYEAFTISDFGDWTLYDGDGSFTYTISSPDSQSGDYEYPNAGYQMAFQVLNPGKAGIKGHLWDPYLGEQMAVCFAAAECDNNDWLISPKVKGGTTVSFMAKSVVDSYGLEEFNFCYSTEDDPDPGFFDLVDAKQIVPAGEWTRYEFELPADATYFAINCVSSDTYALLIDDITFVPAEPEELNVIGYNVYRDGEKINSSLIGVTSFTDRDAKNEGVHVYHVTALLDKGETPLSDPCNVDMSGVATIGVAGLKVRTGNGCVEIFNGADNNVQIVDINGVILFNERVGDYARVALERGVYLVKIQDRVIKVKL